MIDFPAGAWRPASAAMRANRLASANDLVNRTLARHGLAVEPETKSTGTAAHSAPLSDILARFGQSGGRRPEPALPEGATFADDSFTCPAGTRRYRTYVPASARDGVTGLVVMLHGCTQTPEDFAIGTGMNALAETHRFIVVYPHQARGDNAQSCWNWFSRGDQQRDRGEPAILAGLTREAIARHGVPDGRTFVAGLSAGAAMAVILGDAYPELFSAVGAHSGLPTGSAKDLPSAYAAMAGQGSPGNVAGPAVRTIVFHGSADKTVHPSNGEKIARRALDRGPQQSLQHEESGATSGRSFRHCTTYGTDGTEAVEHWVVEGLGHAWSGGQAAGSYTDAQGPDASAEMVRFFFAS
ncbi:esterase, PHB depolymerase family [Jannaschia seosinensis]|uniref:Esterase, PHB depolymerase family n=1 Tax=Jannaschia seosinensis TaxID=313367 RepID=A0A0M7B815_9RHOB|nr:PHB depolymerase family esterase [Jannaschia seosinensis]CUH11650.1 esterase, PHB depolymerase family [Jannaschia seosinensis]